MLLIIPAQRADNPAASFHSQELVLVFCPREILPDLLKINWLMIDLRRQMWGDRLPIDIGYQVWYRLANTSNPVDMQCIARLQNAMLVRLGAGKCCLIIAAIIAGIPQFLYDQSRHIGLADIRTCSRDK